MQDLIDKVPHLVVASESTSQVLYFYESIARVVECVFQGVSKHYGALSMARQLAMTSAIPLHATFCLLVAGPTHGKIGILCSRVLSTHSVGYFKLCSN